jgi:single-stranded DNA-binding protein
MNGVVEPIDYKLSQDTDRPYKEEDVFKKKKYDYFNVKIFGKKNEHAEMFQKGDLVEFFGHIKTTVYINKDGVKTKEYYLKATSQKLIETQDQYDNPRAYAQKLNNKQPEKHQYFKSIQPENAEIIEDDDIPF